VEGHAVEIESDIENGLPGLLLIGLPDTALREARDRIRAAIINSGEQWPQRRITVGLSPASLPKRGSGFDVSIVCLEQFYGGASGAGGQAVHDRPGDARLGGSLPEHPAVSKQRPHGRVP
jgi:magnesium chelatase family protein